MKRAFVTSGIVIATLLLIVAGCGSSGDLSRAETQRQFGVRMAKMNLWREAMFRFQRAVQIQPDNAMAHSNLAVAYEANGDFDGALREYREAMRLDRSNSYIQKNYSRFVEFTQRSKKRAVAAAAATTTAAPKPIAPAADASSQTPPPTTTDITTTNPPDGGSR
ncbi:MAG TPA: tetratricopeptide repeat protein [Thermoanaerobaculia bacterium]|nr:tetratricopeptide repeat protein [Thermoanaerobaculia bacterium]